MKLSKTNIIILILNIIIIPLLGNTDIINILHLNLIANILNYLLPTILVISLIFTLVKNKYKPKINIIIIIISIFIISILISLLFAITYKGYTFTNLYKFILLIIILYLLSLFDLDNKYIRRSVIFLTIFISIYGILQYIFNFQLTLNGIEKYIGSIGRIKSTFLIATICDKYLSFVLIYIVYLLFNKKDNIFLLIITYILIIIALGLTYSRTGLLITLTNIFILSIYFIKNKKYRYLIIIPITIFILLFIPGEKYVLQSIHSVFNTKIEKIFNIKHEKEIVSDNQIESGNDYSVISRDSYMDVAKKIIKERPLTGIGIGNYTYIYDNQNVNDYIKDKIEYHYLYPHNMYYQLGAEIGIIGLLSFFLIIIYNLVTKKNIFAYLLLIAILGSCITETIFYIKDISYITIILISLIPKKKS